MKIALAHFDEIPIGCVVVVRMEKSLGEGT